MFKFKNSLAIGLLLTSFVTAEASTITFKISKPIKDADVILKLYTNSDKKTVKINAKGEGSIEIKDQAQYATLQYKRTQRVIYLNPKQDLMVSFDAEANDGKMTFTGKNAPINTYLNSGKIGGMGYNDGALKEDRYLQKSDSLYAANCNNLKSAKLPKDFTTLETKRLQFSTYSGLLNYPFYYPYLSKDNTYKPSDKLFNKVKELAVVDANLLCLQEYKSFIVEGVKLLAMKEDLKAYSKITSNFFTYIEQNINDTKVAEYLVYNYSYEYVSNSGLDKADEIIATFNKYVKDEAYVTKFKGVCDKWEKIKTGNPSPKFAYLDINGKKVSLDDLKGKYVYIDVWATWCGPCRGELPHLKKLEEKYGEKDIYFVSISCDQNKKAWEQMVKKDELKGIQLHAAGDDTFMTDYIINGIPRFILLDREGKIVNCNATRPSDPKTAETFDALLAK